LGSKHLCIGRISTASFSAILVSKSPSIPIFYSRSTFLQFIDALVDMHSGSARVRVRSVVVGLFPLSTCRWWIECVRSWWTICVRRSRQHVIASLIPLKSRSVPIDCHAHDEHHLCAELFEIASI
jgi:hypothetical protein